MNNTPQSSTNNRSWYFVDWNIRGVNSQERWDDIRQRSNESNCNIICLQETKREHFDLAYIKNFCHRKFNKFAYSPSMGNSGGIITIWNGSQFDGSIISQSGFQITVKFICKASNKAWYLTNIYGPASNKNRGEFITWLADLDSTYMNLWMILGDFNLVRDTSDRSRPGGDTNNMLALNSVMQAHDLEEIPLKGRAFTWSNMQANPLLEKLDWVFTSAEWTT